MTVLVAALFGVLAAAALCCIIGGFLWARAYFDD